MLRVMTGVLLAMCYAGIGAGLALHLAALLAAVTVPNLVLLAMHLGIFVVALPTIIISNKVLGSIRPKDMWAAMRAATPVWFQRFATAVGIYWLTVFVVFLLLTGRETPAAGPMPPRTLMYFTAGWTIGYAGLAQYLYLARNRLLAQRRCAQGHEVAASARYCEVCGTPLNQV